MEKFAPSGEPWRRSDCPSAVRSRLQERVVYGKLIVEERELPLFRDALDRALAKKEDLALYCPSLHRPIGDEARAAADDAALRGLEVN